MRLLLFSIAFTALSFSSISAQTKHFTGNWTKIGTTYDFSFTLHLKHLHGNKVKGYFKWELVSYDENYPLSVNHYKNRIGKKAKEFVSGTYDKSTKTYHLKGYKKEDPDLIIGKDYYKIQVDENGDIGGDTRTSGTWQGRINGKYVLPEPT